MIARGLFGLVVLACFSIPSDAEAFLFRRRRCNYGSCGYKSSYHHHYQPVKKCHHHGCSKWGCKLDVEVHVKPCAECHPYPQAHCKNCRTRKVSTVWPRWRRRHQTHTCPEGAVCPTCKTVPPMASVKVDETIPPPADSK